MRQTLLCALLPALAWASGAEKLVSKQQTFRIRGQEQGLQLISGSDNGGKKPPVIFLPGDGGWRGVAVAMAETIAGWGYTVYGFDVKKYLEGFTQGGKAALTEQQMADDLRALLEHAGGGTLKPVIVGWSQGAGMGVLAAASAESSPHLLGVVTLGLPESAVLGWRWKDTFATLARQEPDEPHFFMSGLLPRIRTPIWMIHPEDDEYTRLETARQMFQKIASPKEFRSVVDGNHRFDGPARDESYRVLREGLEWLTKHTP